MELPGSVDGSEVKMTTQLGSFREAHRAEQRCWMMFRNLGASEPRDASLRVIRRDARERKTRQAGWSNAHYPTPGFLSVDGVPVATVLAPKHP